MDDFEWNVVNEGQLLDAMVGHKPVGVNKYFQMAFIWEKFTENIKKDVNSSKIWGHLGTMYNLQVLDENEALPFPNEERDFQLPDSEFGALKMKKEDDRKIQKGRETPKNLKEIKKDDIKLNKSSSNGQRRDSRDSKDGPKPVIAKKDMNNKKESDKNNVKVIKGRNSTPSLKEESKSGKVRLDDIPRQVKRPTRGSLKPDEGNNGGKASPINVQQGNNKRRRI